MKHDRNLIAGRWVGAADGQEREVRDPATDDLVAKVPWGGGAEAEAAIASAAEAWPEWRARTAAERAKPLLRFAALMHERADVLAELMTREQGKPVAEARGEVAYAASFLEYAAEEGKRVHGEIVPASARNKRILVLQQPVGVTACITPWNFPLAMITRKLGPALAAGCPMIVKPAEQTPLSALALGALAMEAGIPPGVVNVITGEPRAIAKALLSSPTVRKLSFTGSTAVGKLLMAQAAEHLTRLSLELGGHAPFIVFDDADLEAAVEGALANKYRNMGQTCISTNRFFVQDGIYDAFVRALKAKVEALKLGPGLEEGVRVGPLIDDDAVQKVEAHVKDALERGARLTTGGRAIRPRDGLTSRFFQPTILEEVTGEMLVSREETFGPVSPIRRFSREEEAVAWANDSPYGLAAYFYTRDASRLMRVAEALEYGIIGANDAAPSTAQAPFGGMKQSGIGREGGHWVMREYLEVKYVSWGL